MKSWRAPSCCEECWHCGPAGTRGFAGPASPRLLEPPGPAGAWVRAVAFLRRQHSTFFWRRTGSTTASFSALREWSFVFTVEAGRGTIADASRNRTKANAAERMRPLRLAQPRRCCTANTRMVSTLPAWRGEHSAKHGRPWSMLPLPSTEATSTCPRPLRPSSLRLGPGRSTAARNDVRATTVRMPRERTPGRRMAGVRSRERDGPGARAAVVPAVGYTPLQSNPGRVARSLERVRGRQRHRGARVREMVGAPAPLRDQRLATVARAGRLAPAGQPVCASAGRGPPVRAAALPPRLLPEVRRRGRWASCALLHPPAPLLVVAVRGWPPWASVPGSTRRGCRSLLLGWPTAATSARLPEVSPSLRLASLAVGGCARRCVGCGPARMVGTGSWLSRQLLLARRCRMQECPSAGPALMEGVAGLPFRSLLSAWWRRWKECPWMRPVSCVHAPGLVLMPIG